MLARNEWERLLAAVVEIYAGPHAAESKPQEEASRIQLSQAGCAELLEPEDQALIDAATRALERIVRATEAGSSLPPPRSAIVGALGGAEMVMRAELIAGRAERLPSLLPSFTYLATLPFLGPEEALRKCQRAREILGVEPSA